jgi:hypothetical protein
MKIKDEDFVILRDAISPLDTADRRNLYLEGKFPRAESCKNLDMRYRWDLLYASRLKVGDGVGIQGDVNLYAYLDDTHIDTALRNLVPSLNTEEISAE